MKKYFYTLLLIALITPSIAFASWWNPFSWGIFHRTDTKTEVLENRIKELENKLETTAVVLPEKNNTLPKTVTPTASFKEVNKTSVIHPKNFIAECNLSKNEIMEGDSFKAEIFTPFENISNYEVQWDKRYLINQIDNSKAVLAVTGIGQKNILVNVVRKADGYSRAVGCSITVKKDTPAVVTSSPNGDLCQEAKANTVALAQQKEAALAEHNAKILQIQQNSSGMFGGGLESVIYQEGMRYQILENSLNAQLTTANYKVLQYCE